MSLDSENKELRQKQVICFTHMQNTPTVKRGLNYYNRLQVTNGKHLGHLWFLRVLKFSQEDRCCKVIHSSIKTQFLIGPCLYPLGLDTLIFFIGFGSHIKSSCFIILLTRFEMELGIYLLGSHSAFPFASCQHLHSVSHFTSVWDKDLFNPNWRHFSYNRAFENALVLVSFLSASSVHSHTFLSLCQFNYWYF